MFNTNSSQKKKKRQREHICGIPAMKKQKVVKNMKNEEICHLRKLENNTNKGREENYRQKGIEYNENLLRNTEYQRKLHHQMKIIT